MKIDNMKIDLYDKINIKDILKLYEKSNRREIYTKNFIIANGYCKVKKIVDKLQIEKGDAKRVVNKFVNLT